MQKQLPQSQRMKKAKQIRFLRNNFQTVSILIFDTGEFVFMLEPQWNNNTVKDSCIPVGSYHVLAHVSPSKGKCFKVFSIGQDDVMGRDEILVHVGNYRKNTLGCQLPGLGLSDIDKDGNLDVTSSADALRKLFAIAPNGYEVEIVNA
jgi:hypothetical protein